MKKFEQRFDVFFRAYFIGQWSIDGSGVMRQVHDPVTAERYAASAVAAYDSILAGDVDPVSESGSAIVSK